MKPCYVKLIWIPSVTSVLQQSLDVQLHGKSEDDQ